VMWCKDIVKMTRIEGQRYGANGGQDSKFKIDWLLNLKVNEVN